MAKGFLETLGAAYDDHSLVDVIPVRRPKSRKPGAQRSGGRKPVTDKPVTPEPADPKDRQHSASRRKSFLGLLHDTFDQDNVDELIDLPVDVSGKKNAHASNSRIIVFIDEDIAEKAKALAKKRKTELRHVVEEALKEYLND